jgi:hypothetical protein
MLQAVLDALTALRKAAAAIDNSRLTGSQAARLVSLFTEGERICASARTRAVRRVEATNIWQRDGHRTAAEWVASNTGTTLGNAIGVLDTARRLEELPATREAFAAGSLSESQAREVASAAYADPKKERALLAVARTKTMKELRAECRAVRLASLPDELAAYEAVHRSRYLRYWSDPDGAVRFDGRMTPDAGASIIAKLDQIQDKLAAAARRSGRHESMAAHRADALVELAAGTGPSGPRAMVHVLVDHRVLRSARRATADQRCEIPGVGRIPGATARALAGDAFIKAIVTKGVDVTAVAHVGRTIPARMRTALELRDPVCVVPGCDSRDGLEIDHYRIPWAAGGPTRLDNLARLCRWHHYAKTHLGYRLSGTPGTWVWETPDQLDHAARPPPES